MPKKVKKLPQTGKAGGPVKGVAKCSTKKKLTTGQRATYGKLKQQTGDGTSDRDHIPSNAALQARARKLAKRNLTKTEAARVKNVGEAIVLPKKLHKQGRTYGGKNTAAQSSSDAKDLAKAAKQDIKAYEKVSAPKTLTAEMKKMPKSNKEYDKMLLGAIKKKK